MVNIYLLVEGQSEEAFVNLLLKPHYNQIGLYLNALRTETSTGHKGGVSTYGKISRDLDRLCKGHPREHVSTMLDLYALPKDFPGKTSKNYPAQGNGHQKATFLEIAFGKAISHRNFIPNILAHEFEALLLTQVNAFEKHKHADDDLQPLYAIRDTTAPEDINETPSGAPSKRIKSVIPRYKKLVDGIPIAHTIGLDTIRNACPHFDGWLKKLERLLPA